MIGVAAALALLPLQTREARVLDLVRELEGAQRDVFWYRHARFEHEESSAGEGPVIRMRTFASCGNGLCAPGAEALRALARELFAIYGLEAVRGTEGAAAGLDVLDAGRRVGFELLPGDLRPEEARVEEDLALEEIAALERAGFRLHVAVLDRYLSTEKDVFTPTLAFLAGLVEFLNSVTDGEDVELGGFLFEREAQLAWPGGSALVLGPGVRLESEGTSFAHSVTIALREPGFVRASFAGAPDFQPPEPWGTYDAAALARRTLTGSTAGAPGVLALSIVPLVDGIAQERPLARVRLVQERAGARPLVHEGSSPNLFLPGQFDLARPFVLELEFTPGRYRLNAGLRVGAASP